MRWQLALLLATLLAILATPALAQADETMSIDDCVATALAQNATLSEAEAKVREYEARLAEVESTFYPKVQAMGYLAPMFTVTGGVADYESSWTSASDWGPYLHLQARFVQVLYTFERGAHGEQAAKEHSLVYEAKLREAELVVALEVKRLAYLHLYAKSMMPALNRGQELIGEALVRAREEFDKGSGVVTMADVMKLEYFSSKLSIFRLQAEIGAGLALSAIKHTMGVPEDTPLVLTDERLSKDAPMVEVELAELVAEAARQRPEWAQIEHGLAATDHLQAAEALAMAPVLFLGGELTTDWTPMRDDAENPYVYDPYNQLTGGIAVGLMWDFDPAKSVAKTEQARAMHEQVLALKAFAETGIPLRVRKAREDVRQFAETAALAREGVQAAKKWMVFSAASFGTGLGEAREVLEGVGAYLDATATHYGALRDYNIALAELDFAVGRVPTQRP